VRLGQAALQALQSISVVYYFLEAYAALQWSNAIFERNALIKRNHIQYTKSIACRLFLHQIAARALVSDCPAWATSDRFKVPQPPSTVRFLACWSVHPQVTMVTLTSPHDSISQHALIAS
jgi:hypothetical protein